VDIHEKARQISAWRQIPLADAYRELGRHGAAHREAQREAQRRIAGLTPQTPRPERPGIRLWWRDE